MKFKHKRHVIKKTLRFLLYQKYILKTLDSSCLLFLTMSHIFSKSKKKKKMLYLPVLIKKSNKSLSLVDGFISGMLIVLWVTKNMHYTKIGQSVTW